MKKAMLLGMVLLTMVFGVTGCGNKAEAMINHLTDEQIIEMYLYEEEGILADTIEVNEYTGDRYDDKGIQRIDDDCMDVIAYEDGEIVYFGSIDISWAENDISK